MFTANAIVEIETVCFTLGEKWTVICGGSHLQVSIQDNKFMKKVSNREISFRSGDQLIVSLTMQLTSENKRSPFSFIVNEVYGWG